MKNTFVYNDLKNQKMMFWKFFFCSCFPNGYLEDEDIDIVSFIQDNYSFDMEWVNKFTKYYNDIFEKNDGYVENPRTLIAELNNKNQLKIEFHSGDTIFYLNNEEIGCTGAHFKLHTVFWNDFICLTNGLSAETFFLLLPMVYINNSEYGAAEKVIGDKLLLLPFGADSDNIILKCILENISDGV